MKDSPQPQPFFSSTSTSTSISFLPPIFVLADALNNNVSSHIYPATVNPLIHSTSPPCELRCSSAFTHPHSQLFNSVAAVRDGADDGRSLCDSASSIALQFDDASLFLNVLSDPQFVFVEASEGFRQLQMELRNPRSSPKCKGDQHARQGYGFKSFVHRLQLGVGVASLSLSHQKQNQFSTSTTSISSTSQESDSQVLFTNPSSEPISVDFLKSTDVANVADKAVTKSGKLMSNFSVMERAWIGAMAGGIAGAFTYACLHPLDTIKTKLQTRGASQIYSGSLDVFLKVLQKEGILGFYSGISAVLVGSTFSSAIYFGTCEFGKSLLSKMTLTPPLIIPPIAGAIGNIVSSSILVPKEVITQKMQAGAAGTAWQILLRILETQGLKGLYVGYSASLLRNLPTSVLSFSTFEYMKAAWLASSKKASMEPWQSVTSGAIAGAIAATLTTPLDVVKTRLMTQSIASIPLGPLKTKVATYTYKGVSSTLKQIWIEEGWIGLTRGVGPRLLHSACFSAIGFFAFETARLEIVRQQMERRVSMDLKVPSLSAAVS